MLINLYGNIVNPNTIMRVKLSTSGDGYVIYFPGVVDASSAQEPNYIEISSEIVQRTDELDIHDTSILYMLNMINQLTRLVNTSAKKEINTDVSGKTSNNAR